MSDEDNYVKIFATDNRRLISDIIKVVITCNNNKLSLTSFTQGQKGPIFNKTYKNDHTEIVLGKYQKKYAIIIGVSDYKYLSANPTNECNLCDLKYCHKDAEKFRLFLNDKERSGGNWEITYLTNEAATSSSVDEALTGVLTSANTNDLIFIFFSGHGRSHPSKPDDVYLLTYDFEPKNNRSGFDYAVLRNLMINSKAEHIITFLDACKTGIVGFKGGNEGNFNQDAFVNKLNQMPKNKLIFASGRGSQVSWEDTTLKQGVFSYFLIKGLNGEAPENKNPEFVDLGELEPYVTKMVENYIKKCKDKQPQKPQLSEASGIPQDDFPVAIRRKR